MISMITSPSPAPNHCAVFRRVGGGTHCELRLVGAHEEKQLGDEEVGPQVAVDVAVVAVPGRPLTAQRGEAAGQAHQGHRDAHPRDPGHQQLLYPHPGLGGRTEQRLDGCFGF